MREISPAISHSCDQYLRTLPKRSQEIIAAIRSDKNRDVRPLPDLLESDLEKNGSVQLQEWLQGVSPSIISINPKMATIWVGSSCNGHKSGDARQFHQR
jgi:hypothetical protein